MFVIKILIQQTIAEETSTILCKITNVKKV